MKIGIGVLFLTALAASTFTAASAATLNLSTGLDSNANLITTDLGCDANWVQTSGPSDSCAGNAGQVVMSGDPDWYGGWVADGPNSNWITSDASRTGNGAPLPVTYEVSFYLADTAGASLSGSWTVDDGGEISLNGTQLQSLGDGNWSSLSPLTTDTTDLVAGLNTLSISITDSDDYLEGVRFEGSVTGDGASFVTPEPGSLTLLGLGALALGLMRRRKA
jgi:hypothetical protein